ncbi:MAG: hypothetical protein ABF979_16180 [Gluconobacter sp.]|uniref:hypothetical protein n=1 Tax=Gluconobacter sp. TaxID=1876758 RepID=UPI0039E96B78
MADAIQPWLAKEMLRQAEATCKARVDAINKTRDRASTLLGWSVAALTGSIALAARGFDGRSALLFTGLILCAGFAAVCFCCVAVLLPLKLERMAFYPLEVEQIAADTNASSEDELQIALADKLALIESKNAVAHERRQRWLKCAWLASLITPALSFAALVAFS